jgi:error-prone DNA polymerase
VLVRQKPGSANGVLFVTLEDETGIANLVIWSTLFEKQRRVVLGARMLGVDGRIQREGEVVHIVASRLHDLSEALASVGARDAALPLPSGRGDDARRSAPGLAPYSPEKPRDIYIPDLSLGAIKIRTRDFR